MTRFPPEVPAGSDDKDHGISTPRDLPSANGADGPQELADSEVDARWQELAGQLSDLKFLSDDGGTSAMDSRGPRDHSVDLDVDDEESRFVEPTPELDLDSLDPQVRLGWFGLILGLLGMITVVVVDGPQWLAALLGLAAAAGVVALVFSLPAHRENDGGNGAVV